MLKIDVCIEPFFVGTETTEKIRNVKKLGIDAIEFWFWDHEFDGQNLIPNKKNIQKIASVSKFLNVTINDIVVNSPDGSIGGFLTRDEDREKYLERLKETIDIAHKLDCKKLITCTGNEVTGVNFKEQYDSVVKTLRKAAEIAQKEGITLVLEALNSPIDHPGYFLTSSKIGFDIVKEVNNPALRLLYDIYHMQVMGEDHVDAISNNISLIGHFHAAGVPGRNEIYSGEIDYPSIFSMIDNSGYDGYVGLEYWPKEEENSSLLKTLDYIRNI